ncbi:29027_t:CDS:2, partial [Gigaspora margarita]
RGNVGNIEISGMENIKEEKMLEKRKYWCYRSVKEGEILRKEKCQRRENVKKKLEEIYVREPGGSEEGAEEEAIFCITMSLVCNIS